MRCSSAFHIFSKSSILGPIQKRRLLSTSHFYSAEYTAASKLGVTSHQIEQQRGTRTSCIRARAAFGKFFCVGLLGLGFEGRVRAQKSGRPDCCCCCCCCCCWLVCAIGCPLCEGRSVQRRTAVRCLRRSHLCLALTCFTRAHQPISKRHPSSEHFFALPTLFAIGLLRETLAPSLPPSILLVLLPAQPPLVRSPTSRCRGGVPCTTTPNLWQNVPRWLPPPSTSRSSPCSPPRLPSASSSSAPAVANMPSQTTSSAPTA